MLLIALAIIKIESDRFNHLFNPMFVALGIWCTFCTLEVLNDTCGLGLNFGLWYTGARMMAFQLMYAFVIFTLYITTPKILLRYLVVWAGLATFATLWIWKQKYIGLTVAERSFLYGAGSVTHIIGGGTIIRLFSIFSDAANCGVNFASTAVAFLIFGLTNKILRYKIFFLVVGFASMMAMGATGTRTAMACFIVGVGAYVFFSKSFKLGIPVFILLGLLYFFLAFTKIANSNAEIRRMRSAFNKEDASMDVRYNNQAVMKKYLAEAPWGIGLGNNKDLPANHKYYRLNNIPCDSEYVYIWVHTGVIGITTFLIINGIILLGASFIIFFRLRNKSLLGIASGFTCAFISLHLGGYGNQVLMQFPNCLLFYGGMAIVYVLPGIEPEWNEYEAKLLEKQNKKKRLREESKLVSRV